jgi:hypothetical protein
MLKHIVEGGAYPDIEVKVLSNTLIALEQSAWGNKVDEIIVDITQARALRDYLNTITEDPTR